MTTTKADRPTGGDFRRAAALLAHHAGNDADGVAAVLDEAEEAGRLRALVWTVPSVLGGMLPGWHEPGVADMLRTAAQAFAELEVGGDGSVA